MARLIYQTHHQSIPVACTSETIVYIQPLSATIKIGESFEASAIATACGWKTSYDITWLSNDNKIASVISDTGFVTAIAAGKTTIKPYYEFNPRLELGRIEITVIE